MSFYSKSENIFDSAENSHPFQKALDAYEIDCVVNARFTNFSHLLLTEDISTFSLNDLLSVGNDIENCLYFDCDFETKYLTKSIRIFKYFSSSDAGNITLKNIDILTNLPIDHLLEFNKINRGYAQALSLLEKRTSQSIIRSLINKIKVNAKKLKSNK